MKAPKNFEAIFLAAAVFCTFTAYASAEAPVTTVAAPSKASVVVDANTQTVVVKAKRMTAAQKAAFN